jgi:DNA-binding transcriptional LysR family regulator
MKTSPATGFDYNLIPFLITIVETSSMVAAAEVLDVAPSAVSYAVKKLRLHYNDQLFIRSLNGVKPTALANNLYERFKMINDDITSVIDLKPTTQTKTRTVYIRADALAELWITEKLMSSGLVPNECILEFKYGAINAEERIHKLRTREIDLDIGLAFLGDTNITSQTIAEWKYILICRKDHRTVGKSITKQQFLTERYVAYNARFYSTIMYNNVNEILIARTQEPTIRSESSMTLVITTLYNDLLMFIPAIYFPMLSKTFPIKHVECDFFPDTHISNMVHMNKKNFNDPLLNKIIAILKQ